MPHIVAQQSDKTPPDNMGETTNMHTQSCHFHAVMLQVPLTGDSYASRFEVRDKDCAMED